MKIILLIHFIRFHKDDEPFESDADDDNYYHVYPCKYCGIFSNQIRIHMNHRHHGEMHGATPMLRGRLALQKRPRRLDLSQLEPPEEE